MSVGTVTAPTVGRAPTGGAPASSRASGRAGAERRFLPEVQALRALAVGLVVVYHVRPDLLPGGFIGVDVFFVVSGFLITGHLLREVRETGRVSLAGFWAARARRLLPASLLVLAFVTVTCTFVLPASEWEAVHRQLLASVLYVENWALAADAVDYLAADDAATPVQHFWSLAAEEQFYLLWPVAVLGAVALARRLRRADVGVLGLVLGSLVVASFVWNLVAVGRGDATAYFATTTRLWELGLGGLLALGTAGRGTPRVAAPVRNLAALAGVAAIVAGAFLLDRGVGYPGTAALVPVLGAALVVVAGRTRGPGSLTPLVDLPAVQWLGNVSYSVYLWHFPFVVYALAWSGRPPSSLEGVGIVVVTLGVAALSHRYVEQPFRRRRASARTTLLVAAGATAVVVALTGLVTLRSAAEQERWDAASAAVDVRPGSRFGAEAARDGGLPPFVDGQTAVVPAPGDIADDVSPFDEGSCSAQLTDAPDQVTSCERGDPQAEVTVALVGDSHARMLGSPVAAIAQERGWRLVTFLRNSCPFSTEARTVDSGPRCVAANEVVLDRLLELGPDAVVTAAYAGSQFADPGTGERPGARGFAEKWAALEEAGTDVFAVKDAPQADEDVVRCVASSPREPAGCGVPREEGLAGRDVVDDAARLAPEVDVVDLTDLFCGPETCPAVVGSVVVYRDSNHITDTYARSLTPALAGALEGVTGR